MKRFAVLVAWVLGAAAVGALSSAQSAVAQQTTESSGLCDTAQVEQFTDIADGDYAAAYVLCMRALGLSQGAGAGTYGPDRKLNRAQMASFLVRLWRDVLGKDCPTGVAAPFTDVDAGSTHATNIECLYGLEITTGTGPDTYGPRDPLKATQISRFLYRVYREAGGDMCPGTDGSELNRATECLVQLRVVPTTAEATSTGAVTRAQMGVYMVGLWHNLTGRGLPPPPPLLGTPTPTQPTQAEPTAQHIAYTVTPKDGNHELWVINAGSANQTKTTGLPDGAKFERLLWSPDGRVIAYEVDTDSGISQLWVWADPDRTSPTQLTDRLSDWDWLPTGALIYTTYGDGPHWEQQLWVADADGTNRKLLAADISYPVWSPDGTKIAYEVVEDIRGDGYDGVVMTVSTWVMDTDGTNRKLLANVPSISRGFLWSPTGTGILYTVSTDAGDQSWVADADGTNNKLLLDADWPGDNAWSPNGSQIAYTVGSDEGNPLWVADADGTNPTKLTDRLSWQAWDWSPNGRHIAYGVDTADGGPQLWVAGADGTNPTKLGDNSGSGHWSPDATHIVYIKVVGTGDDWRRQLWAADADGTNRTKIADSSGQSVYWSPDGNQFAYTVGSDEGDQLWVANVNGENPTKLSSAVLYNHRSSRSMLSWSPDGARIVYIKVVGTGDDRSWPLRVADADGTNNKLIDTGAPWDPVWSPDGTHIVYWKFVQIGDEWSRQLWVADADGTDNKLIAADVGEVGGGAENPVWWLFGAA